MIEHVLNTNESSCMYFSYGHVPKKDFINEFNEEYGGDLLEDEIIHGRLLTRSAKGYFGDYKIGELVTYYREDV